MPQAVPAIVTAGKVAGAVGAVKSLTDGGGSAAGQTTTTQQVDPQTQAMQQDLYKRRNRLHNNHLYHIQVQWLLDSHQTN